MVNVLKPYTCIKRTVPLGLNSYLWPAILTFSDRIGTQPCRKHFTSFICYIFIFLHNLHVHVLKNYNLDLNLRTLFILIILLKLVVLLYTKYAIISDSCSSKHFQNCLVKNCIAFAIEYLSSTKPRLIRRRSNFIKCWLPVGLTFYLTVILQYSF